MLFLYILKNAIRAEQIESCAASYPYQNAPQNVFVFVSVSDNTHVSKQEADSGTTARP